MNHFIRTAGLYSPVITSECAPLNELRGAYSPVITGGYTHISALRGAYSPVISQCTCVENYTVTHYCGLNNHIIVAVFY